MTKYFCDNCGKELKRMEHLGPFTVGDVGGMAVGLCRKCYDKFRAQESAIYSESKKVREGAMALLYKEFNIDVRLEGY